jgi:hypothetical protein
LNIVESWRMSKPPPIDDLSALRDLLDRLEAGEMTLRRGQEDVSEHGIDVLRTAVARLEAVLERKGSDRKSDKTINYSGRTKRFSRSDK